MRRTLRLVSDLLLLLSGLNNQVLSQVNTASLTGLITDPSGSVVAGAAVIARNRATNVSSSSATDGSGYYVFASLPVGAYDLSVESQGFKKAVREDVVLQVGQKARIDFSLEVGEVTQSVAVEGTAPLLTTQEASTGTVIENRLVTDLPLSLRNWDDLLGLVAGVQGDRYTEEGGGTAAGRTGGVNVHGVRSLQNNFVLDGVDNNSISTNVQELTTQVARPSVDSIQEFKISTNPYSAENGRSPGSLISVTTKGGTNGFHGALYEFHRNRVFDANNFFLNRSGRDKGQNIQNQFGGNVGGPVVKDRAFFFFNYEGTRIRKGTTRLGNDPCETKSEVTIRQQQLLPTGRPMPPLLIK
ncbi:MAG: carboxypeptidase-like regulatory domain-containing protein [Acidobacteria bacterium]|nr:carboxypeptidase-like regulatory domain-containing protein [Acidobacteriota bacterium]